MKLRSVAVLAVAAPLALVACGGDDGGSSSASTSLPAVTSDAATGAPASDFNDADVEFLQGMIPHHEQAIEMAEVALDPSVGASAEVVDIATRIKAAQDPEIEQMTAWLTAWGQPLQMDTSGGHDMSSMEGTMTAEEMDMLGAATGAEFDAMWTEMMIRHHQGAISMAQDVKANGANPDVLQLADQIIAAQQAEVTELQALPGGS
jgi:uncharacterized protein (DUF305 family)